MPHKLCVKWNGHKLIGLEKTHSLQQFKLIINSKLRFTNTWKLFSIFTVWWWEIHSGPSSFYIIKNTSVKWTFMSSMSNLFCSVLSISFSCDFLSVIIIVIKYDFNMLRLLKHSWWFKQLLLVQRIFVFVCG